MTIQEWQKKVYYIAVSKGWYDPELKPATPLERHMLIVSEVAEATEEVRNSKSAVYLAEQGSPNHDMTFGQVTLSTKIIEAKSVTEEAMSEIISKMPHGKPEGEAIELADAVIRIMDYFESKGWDLESAIKIKSDYNETRPYRHGGKTA